VLVRLILNYQLPSLRPDRQQISTSSLLKYSCPSPSEIENLWMMGWLTSWNPSRYEGVTGLLEGSCPHTTVSSPMRNPEKISVFLGVWWKPLYRVISTLRSVSWNSTKVETLEQLSRERALLRAFVLKIPINFLLMCLYACPSQVSFFRVWAFFPVKRVSRHRSSNMYTTCGNNGPWSKGYGSLSGGGYWLPWVTGAKDDHTLLP